MGDLGGEDVEVYSKVVESLQAQGSLTEKGCVIRPI